MGTLAWRKSMSVEDRRTFDIWIKRNAVAGMILMASLVRDVVFGVAAENVTRWGSCR